ncbi:MAG: YkgJ family cysteine cluster protein [Phycisphaerae bacterium]|nr:YkgJ family cysteine cluster protein [Phycisphaerae bacterium]
MAKEKWYQAGLAFECTQCGACCTGPPGYVWVTRKNIKTIARFLGRADDWLPESHLVRVRFRYSLTERPNGDCIFLKHDGDEVKCSIYSVRPLQCRTWPFWNSNLTSAAAWNHANRICPGINRGVLHDFATIEEMRTRKPE